ncbi:hypothetical protein [Ruegeria sp.]|uniref:hypothetical protein n=1 Tax=Ruegeria sp. TaxID=1879320 RepID=UPI0023230B73|nr:hypothetical protein [Ruegeria sp.]MDA7965360.1 hypothetical protein [Ruegeria sp.]
MEQRYLDGVSNIAMINNNMRIDCFSFGIDPNGDADNPPVEEHLRLVLSPQGFLRAYDIFHRMFLEMEQRGVIKRNGDAAGEAPLAVSAADDNSTNSSPNFNTQ